MDPNHDYLTCLSQKYNIYETQQVTEETSQNVGEDGYIATPPDDLTEDQIKQIPEETDQRVIGNDGYIPTPSDDLTEDQIK